MTNLEKKIYDELVKRFNANGWNDLTIHMKKSDEDVTIEPYHLWNDDKKYSLDTLQYCYVSSSSVHSVGYITFDDVIKFIATYEEHRERTLSGKEETLNFYRKHLQNKHVSMLLDGNHYLDTIMDEMTDNQFTGSLSEFTTNYDFYRLVSDVKDVDYVKEAIELAHNAELYKDMYKSYYNHSPILDPNQDGVL